MVRDAREMMTTVVKSIFSLEELLSGLVTVHWIWSRTCQPL